MTAPNAASRPAEADPAVVRRRRTRWIVLVFKGYVRNRAAAVAAVILALFSLIALFAPWLPVDDPYFQDYDHLLEAPNWSHPMGTDDLGRDILSRIFHGGRVSLQVGLFAVGMATIVGVLAGLTAGFYGRWVDTIIMRIVDVILALPGLVLVIFIVGVLGPSLRNAMFAIAVGYVAPFTRIVRANALSVREQEYITGARAVGATDLRIMLKAMLPNLLSPIIVMVSLGMGVAILIEAGLSFLGLGIQRPTPAWGSMLAQAQVFIELSWWMAVFPGVAIFLTVLSFNFIGDGLRESLDPRQRRR